VLKEFVSGFEDGDESLGWHTVSEDQSFISSIIPKIIPGHPTNNIVNQQMLSRAETFPSNHDS